MKIIVDNREKNSLVLAELISGCMEVELRQLEVADYIIGDTAIERKTISDFISSMMNKRLLQQLNGLQQYPNRLVMIEGIDEHEFYNDKNEGGIHANAIRGMILALIFDFATPVIFTKDSADSAKFLMVLAKRFEKKNRETGLNPKRRAKSVPEQQQFIIEGFPGIGPVTAKNLLKRFRTIKAIINATPEELKKEKKLNSKKAKIFSELINRVYKP
jgi:Fanconi anemia group M protein